MAEAGATADGLQACPMPRGSKGRQALAQGKLLGRAYAPLRLTVPNSAATVDKQLGALQKHANRLVFGRKPLVYFSYDPDVILVCRQ